MTERTITPLEWRDAWEDAQPDYEVEVLTFGSEGFVIGYIARPWEADDIPPQWKRKGRDAYDLAGVEFWAYLPEEVTA